MPDPLVSIVIATYRSRIDHLSVAIASAVGQSWRHLEVIVADDSPDGSLGDLVRGFADARLDYVHNVPALGVAANHGSAFARAKGEYIVVLNHDDWLAPTFAETLVACLRDQPAAVLAFCDHWIIDADGGRLETETRLCSAAWGRAALAPGLHRPFVELVAAQTIPIAMGTMFRRSALSVALPAQAGPAYDLWLSYLLCRGGGAWYVPERLSAWRTHADGLTHQGGLDWLLGSALCWQAVARDDTFASVRATALMKAALAFHACARRSWSAGHRADSARLAMQSLRARPTLRGLAMLAASALPSRLAAALPRRTGQRP